MDYTFCELRAKDVINIVDGRRLGHIADMVFDVRKGIICGLILPVNRGFFFRNYEDIYIPFKDILRIGEDVILVELFLHHEPKIGKKPFGKRHEGFGERNEERKEERREERHEERREGEFCNREIKFDK